jgi:hypothetical protein
MKTSLLFSALLFGSAALTISSQAGANIPSPGPAFTGMKVFEATPPYSVRTRDGLWGIKLGVYPEKVDLKRGFDFVTPIVNSETGHTKALTLQTPYSYYRQMQFGNLSDTSSPVKATNAGSPGRIQYDGTNKLLTIAYRAGDPPSQEKCRVMINSWPLPARRNLTRDLSFKLGGDLPGEAWPMTPATVSPKLLWQIKNDNYETSASAFPSMEFYVDTDTEDSTSIRLTFFQRLSNVHSNDYRWSIGGLKPGQFIDVVVQAGLDDRDDAVNTGIMKVWVNGKLIAYRAGRNLIRQTITTANKDLIASLNRMVFGVYMMSEADPVQQSFVTQWRRARMLVPQ